MTVTLGQSKRINVRSNGRQVTGWFNDSNGGVLEFEVIKVVDLSTNNIVYTRSNFFHSSYDPEWTNYRRILTRAKKQHEEKGLSS